MAEVEGAEVSYQDLPEIYEVDTRNKMKVWLASEIEQGKYDIDALYTLLWNHFAQQAKLEL